MKKGTKVTGMYMGQQVKGEVYNATETTVWVADGEMMYTCAIETVKEIKVAPAKKHVVINPNVRGGGYASKLQAGEYIQRDGFVVEVTGVETVSNKSVRIHGRYLDNGAPYSEVKRTSTYLLTYSRNNIRMAM